MSETAGRTPVLELRNVSTHYGLVAVLRDVDMQIFEGEMVCLLGGNASGKSTTLKTILGYVTPSQGEVVFEGETISGLPTSEVVRRGISMVPENRRLFGDMTVEENLALGASGRRSRSGLGADMERVYGYFPILKERRRQQAGTLSGGEQQMLAVGRALMLQPRLMLLDEPSFGLAPLVVREVFDILAAINRDEKVSMLLVEQNASLALGLADEAYLLETGRIVMSGPAQAIRENESVRRSYLGY